MQAQRPNFVFSEALASRVLQFCDDPGHQAACAEVSQSLGDDYVAMRAVIASGGPVASVGQPGQSGLQRPSETVTRAQNPSLLREVAGGPAAYDVVPTADVQEARRALYAATRLMMRAAPNDALTAELFDAASVAWLAEVTAERDLRHYAANYETLIDTRYIWANKVRYGSVNLMGMAKWPPFFDGNIELVQLFVQGPHLACDITTLTRLPNLKLVRAYADVNAEAMLAHLSMLLPHMTQIKREREGWFELSVPGHARRPHVTRQPN